MRATVMLSETDRPYALIYVTARGNSLAEYTEVPQDADTAAYDLICKYAVGGLLVVLDNGRETTYWEHRRGNKKNRVVSLTAEKGEWMLSGKHLLPHAEIIIYNPANLVHVVRRDEYRNAPFTTKKSYDPTPNPTYASTWL